MNDEAVREVCDWCHQNGVRLIMDEIYHGLTFVNKQPHWHLAKA